MARPGRSGRSRERSHSICHYSLVQKDPYDKGWLFRTKPDSKTQRALNQLVDAQEYVKSLKGSEGYKNPEGLKGGVSGICKAVYSGIRDQEIS
ncbi:MAG: hypothetical protein JRE61_11500 [Deltaproteobacteria bacterium]|nr:hypothetical protein [Deltaproteobacteria bacterium]